MMMMMTMTMTLLLTTKLSSFCVDTNRIRRHFLLIVVLLVLMLSSTIQSQVISSGNGIIPPRNFQLGTVHVEYDSNNTNSKDDRTLQENDNTTQQQQYAPIRIAFDTTVLDALLLQSPNDTELQNKITFIKETILPQTALKWSQHLHVQPISSTTPLGVGSFVCNFLYRDYFSNDTSTYDKVYTDTDLVIIVGGDNPFGVCSSDSGTLAYAFPCEIDTILNRPMYGTFHFCLNLLELSPSSSDTLTYKVGTGNSPLSQIGASNIPYIYSVYTNTTFYTDNIDVSLLDITIHEMTHILGFSHLLYPFTRFDDGTPRTPRDTATSDGVQLPIPIQRMCGNGTITFDTLPPDTVVQVSTSINPATQQYDQFWVTERVKTIAQIHYNCSTISGARLEDGSTVTSDTGAADGVPCFGSHWNERTLYSELLSPTVNQGSENLLSVFTLAFLEDTGWYQVDYRGAGYPSFGLLAGCDFVNQPCIDRTTGQVSSAVQNEFCTTPFYLDTSGVPTIASLNSIYCDTSYQSWVVCDLSNLRQLETDEYTYFPNDPTLSTLFLQRADNCPIPSLNLGLSCLDDTKSYNAFYEGEGVGSNSRCLNAYSESSNGRMYRPACIRITCDVDERLVKIGQGSSEQVCQFDGQTLTVGGDRTDNATFICPRLAAVCPELFTCPDGCFGRGECIYTNVNSNGRTIPTCRCFDTTNTHPSCAPISLVSRVPTPSPTIDALSPSINSPTIDVDPFQPVAYPTVTTQVPARTPVSFSIPSGEPIARVRTDAPVTSSTSSGGGSSMAFASGRYIGGRNLCKIILHCMSTLVICMVCTVLFR